MYFLFIGLLSYCGLEWVSKVQGQAGQTSLPDMCRPAWMRLLCTRVLFNNFKINSRSYAHL